MPHLIARIVREGHAIGVHCDEHVAHTDRDERWARDDVDRALGRLAALRIRPRLWRTPWGRRAGWTDGIARARGLRLVGWSADTHDWRGDTAEAMLAAIDGTLRPGAIVLAHDGIGPGARRPGCAQTVRLVGLLAARTGALGLGVSLLEDRGRPGPALER